MITITSFTISTDLQSVQITINPGLGETIQHLYAWVGEAYLSENPIDLDSKIVGGGVTQTISVTKEELGITTPIINDIITMQAINSVTPTAEEVEASVISNYYENLVLARKIATTDFQASFKEIELLYFLISATTTYLASGMVEEALGTYSRVVAICANYPDYMTLTDLPEYVVGSGGWIVNGKYVIH